MSPHINSLVGDLVAMAQAMERVPQLEQELSQVKIAHDGAVSHNQALELNIINYKQQIEDLNNKVRSLEVERDDASFRVLESEDLAHKALSFAKQAESAAAAVMSLLDPPKPEPELQPQAVPTATDQSIHGSLPEPKPETFSGFEPQGSSESSPTGEQQAGSREGTYTEEAPKSDANPTLVSASGDQTQASASTTAGHTDNVTSGSNQGPYFNKRYHDMANYIGYIDWIDGGGTEVDYFWRPQPRADVF